jgi:hypothetical protein
MSVRAPAVILLCTFFLARHEQVRGRDGDLSITLRNRNAVSVAAGGTVPAAIGPLHVFVFTNVLSVTQRC